MILLSKTYEMWTPDDIEAGETRDTGFVFESVPHTFKELVEILLYCSRDDVSAYPATGSINEWVKVKDDTDFQTGEQEIEHLHFSHNNKPRAAKYWKLAFKAAGLLNTKG